MMALERFRRDLRRHGRQVAVDDGTRTWSYAELEQEVDGWLHVLDAVGANRVAYRLPNGCAWLALDLALLQSGRVAIPVADFFSAEQVHHVLAAGGVDTFVVADPRDGTEGFATALQTSGGAVLHRTVRDPAPVHPGTAKVTFTSGTTGRPKGVCLSASSMLATAESIRAAFGATEAWRHLCVLPLSLLLENVAGVYANLGHGNCVCVPPLPTIGVTGSSGLDVERFVAAQNRYRPQSLILVPQLLLALTAAAEFALPLPDSYRFLAVGGGRVPESLLQRAARAGLPAFEGYGLTECGSVVAVNLPGASRPGTVGRPLENVSVEVTDSEIRVRGRSMLGYLGGEPAADTIATGDLGSLDADGYLRVQGRRKSGFITAFGRNVSPEWIEGELQTELAIAHAVVFGEGLASNVALLVPRGNAGPDAVALAVAQTNARLPDYARVGSWRCVSASDFAAAGCLTDNGRPRREAAAHQYRHLLEQMQSAIEENPNAALPDSRVPHVQRP